MGGSILVLTFIASSVPANAEDPLSQDRETFIKDISKRDGSQNKLGLVIKKIKKDSIFDQIGLVDGDVIKKINRRWIRSSQDSKIVFHDLRSQKKLDLIVLRDGKLINLHHQRK
jgi:type II secretory pathway component PulC